jgi:hypothetical protein
MTYREFVDQLAIARISGREFARLLNLNPNTIANYKSVGTVPNHLAVIAVLIRTLSENGIEYRQQVEALRLRPNARRGQSLAEHYNAIPRGEYAHHQRRHHS